MADAVTRPPDIRLEDLENPIFPDEVVAGLKAFAPVGKALEFNLDALMSAASEGSGGLDDFGSDEYIEPLTVVCESIEKESGFSPMGRISAHTHIVGALTSRLRVENFFKQNPEVQNAEIVAPLIIAGLPRSGTTHLQNLIASDTNLRSLPWWEALEPIPSQEEWGTIEGRVERSKEGIVQSAILMPHFERMHEMTWDHAHEEIALLLIAGSTMQFDTMGVLPSWREYYKSTDQTPYYMYMKRILKALSHIRGGNKRWLLKSPQHLEQFQPIKNTFPDATLLITHRDPLSVIVSMATMLSYSARLNYEAPIDIPRIGHWWKDILKDMLLACVADREIFDESHSMDILFNEFMADDIGTVQKAYNLANQNWDGDVEATMRKYMETHPRGRYGKVIYNLEADFQIKPDELRAELADYIERFDIAQDYDTK